ncbi:MAG TPA: hypothetical protein VHT24_02145 [Pseudacidobacterium sp.]|jgi:hypothetical protein|nr:hypothetical protein [Pseudacidobacterium sp.]
MRFVAIAAATLLLVPCTHAYGADEKIPDTQALLMLEAKADHASPKEQCFLYAQIVHDMTEIAGQEFSAGDFAHASQTLKVMQGYAEKIHMGMADDTHKLKNAEILMRHTAFRLNEILHSASLEDRPTLESTLKQLDQVQSELMMQVFKH